MEIKITDEDRREAQRLIDEGYYQTSRAHRHLARLPEGKTGRQALCDVDAHWIDSQLPESHCGDQYLRVYAPESDQVTVSIAIFAAFRELGGDTYLGKHSKYDPDSVIGALRDLLKALRPLNPRHEAVIDAQVLVAETCLASNERNRSTQRLRAVPQNEAARAIASRVAQGEIHTLIAGQDSAVFDLRRS